MNKLLVNMLVCIGVIATPINTFALKKQNNIFKPGNNLVAYPGINASTISGNLVMGQCHIAPKIYLNNRKTYVKFKKVSSGYRYLINVPANIRRAKVKIVKRGCLGSWTPSYKYVSLPTGHSRVRNINFKFIGSLKEARLPASLLAAVVNSKFRGTQVRLNNYGPRHGNSWYKGGSSFVRLPSALGGGSKHFSIPAINKMPYRYYINSVNLDSVNVGVSGRHIAISMNFESRGTEIKGRCKSGNYVKQLLCAPGSDRAAPDVQMNNAKATVYLYPTARNGSISYSSVRTDFTAKIQAQGVCKISFGLCNKITGYKGKIKSAAKGAVNSLLNNNGIRNKIATALKPLLAQRGIRNVVRVRIVGSNLVILHK